MGTADLACPSLVALARHPRFRVLTVVTQPDRPQGRTLQLQAPPVKRAASQLALTVLQPERARDPQFIDQLAALAPDLIVVAAYGQILPAAILTLPPHGCLNLHTSLLPRYRGAAPIQAAILNGDTLTGVTIMRINEQLDAGDIVAQSSLPIGPDETADQLHLRLAETGAQLLVSILPDYLEGRILPRPQSNADVSYAPKIRREHGRIDWTRPARELYNQFRAFHPWPGTFTFLPAHPQPLRVRICQAQVADASGPPGSILQAGPERLRVACGVQALDLLALQREGGRRLNTREFLTGHRVAAGSTLHP